MSNEKKLIEIISSFIGVAKEKISDDISYESTMSWDSITHLKMVSEIEDEFNIEFEIDEIISMEDIGKIKKIFESKFYSD